MQLPSNNPTPSFNHECHYVEERLYKELLISSNEYNSPGIIRAYVKEIPNLKIVSLESTSKLDKFRKAGLIGSLNESGITSENYKKELYS